MANKKAALSAEKTVINKGIEVLIRKLGHSDTLKFILAIERSRGDSVKEFKELWGDKTVGEIHQQILAAKERGII